MGFEPSTLGENHCILAPFVFYCIFLHYIQWRHLHIFYAYYNGAQFTNKRFFAAFGKFWPSVQRSNHSHFHTHYVSSFMSQNSFSYIRPKKSHKANKMNNCKGYPSCITFLVKIWNNLHGLFHLYSFSLRVNDNRILEMLPKVLSKFLTNDTSQVAKAVTTVGCTIALYVCIAKYAGHVSYLLICSLV